MHVRLFASEAELRIFIFRKYCGYIAIFIMIISTIYLNSLNRHFLFILWLHELISRLIDDSLKVILKAIYNHCLNYWLFSASMRVRYRYLSVYAFGNAGNKGKLTNSSQFQLIKNAASSESSYCK